MAFENISSNSFEFEENTPLQSEPNITEHASQVDPPFEVWEEAFQRLFDRALESFETGVRDPEQLFSKEEKAFLESIGATPQEIFDFVEDWAEEGVPSPEIIRKVTGLRREYFFTVQNGNRPSANPSSIALPSPWAELGGHRWLPRIIAKARAKLRGELPPDIMYGCGMDRPFLQERNIGLPEFLRKVWDAGDDDNPILHYVNQKARGK